MLPPDHDPGDLAPVLAWVNPRFGPITGLYGLRVGMPEPQGWWLYTCELARPPGRYVAERGTACGASLSGTEALQRMLGEAVERHVAAGALAGVETRCLRAAESPLLDRFPRCAEDEPCPPSYRSPEPDEPLTHVDARRISDGSVVPVPAGHVHLHFQVRPPELPVTVPISSGLAFHTELHRSIWSGLCEVAERDAVMIFWENRIPVPRLRLEGAALPDRLAERLARIERAGLRIDLFDIATDFRVPSVFALLRGPAQPYAVVSATCHGDPVAACLKAIDEAMLVRTIQVNFGTSAPVPSHDDFDWVHTIGDHANLYATWPAPPAFDFLLGDNPNETAWEEFLVRDWWPAPASLGELSGVARTLESLGLTPLWCEIGAEEARALGFCTKVVVPEMVPLGVSHRIRWLATPRLRRFAARGSGPNPYPHPFP